MSEYPDPRERWARREADAESEREVAAADLEARAPEDEEQVFELNEEELVAHKELRELGGVTVRTGIEEVPGRLEVDAFGEEVTVEHQPVGQAVSERQEPWQDDVRSTGCGGPPDASAPWPMRSGRSRRPWPAVGCWPS